jgi:hypothetical protein
VITHAKQGKEQGEQAQPSVSISRDIGESASTAFRRSAADKPGTVAKRKARVSRAGGADHANSKPKTTTWVKPFPSEEKIKAQASRRSQRWQRSASISAYKSEFMTISFQKRFSPRCNVRVCEKS